MWSSLVIGPRYFLFGPGVQKKKSQQYKCRNSSSGSVVNVSKDEEPSLAIGPLLTFWSGCKKKQVSSPRAADFSNWSSSTSAEIFQVGLL